jgi:GH24 family phage-related lysozyme (muramidase)
MKQFDKAYNPKTGNKEVLDGLTARRNEEANLLMQT